MASNPVLNDRYQLIEQVGAGGMAVIYRAQDLVLGRIVAVKILRPSLVDNPQFLMRFTREAQSAANLSHPNIVTVYDVGQDGPNTHYIVMEFIDGQNLKNIVRTRGAIEVERALKTIIDVCKGVGYAHRAGLVHCDLKPQNILITSGGMVKVADFGIARAMSRIDDEKEYWGSPHYFSPEQAMGQPPTPASDVYSIGVTLFEILTGRLPFIGASYQELAVSHIKEKSPSILTFSPSLPIELDEIIQKVLSKEPANRYRTGDQFGRILQNFLDHGLHPTASFEALSTDTTPRASRRKTVISAPEETLPAHQPSISQDTLPSLPGIDMNNVLSHARTRRETEIVTSSTPVVKPVPASKNHTLPSNTENIILSILAGAAVLGLIPLWISVILSLIR